MRTLSVLVLLFALIGCVAAFNLTAEAADGELVDFSSEVGPMGDEYVTPSFIESDAESEVEAETEVDVDADAEAESETEMEVQASCGTGGTCRERSTCNTASNTILTGKCSGAASIICCQPKTAARPATPAAPAQAATAFGTTAVSRAGQWVSAKLHYCQAPRGGRDASDSCPRICVRQANPAWDAYRSDCSGLVSYAWGLPAPGVTTSGMSTVSRAVNCNSMRAGDAINRAGHHTMLFVRWVTVGTQAVFYEEPGCAMSEPWARAVTLDLTCSGTSVRTARRGNFIAVRKNGQ